MAMHASAFDRYRAGTSLLHHLDPRVKVVVTVLFIVSNVLVPDGAWLGFLVAFGAVLLLTVVAGFGPGYAVKRSFVALPFALVAVTTIFSVPGTPVAVFSIGPWTLTATDAGLVHCTSIVIRSLLSVQMAILLTATTAFPDLIHALRHLRLPQVIVATIAFMYRYLFVLSDETLRLLRAREARSARQRDGRGGGALTWRARVAGNMAGQLFVRSFERGDRVYQAMLARGYRGHLVTLNPHIMRPSDWVAGAVAVGFLIVLQVVARVPR
jgi:cobalt/nickel transport system permease protein